MTVSQEVLFKIITPKLIITESIDSSANAKIILEEIKIYEDFMSSIKQFLGSRFDDTIKDVSQNIVNMKDAGVLIKNVISDADYLVKVSDQMTVELKHMLSELRATVNTFISKLSNNVKQSGIIQTITKVISVITTQMAKLATFDGWKKFLYSLGMYSFVKFLILKFAEYKADQLINFFTGGAPDLLVAKIAEFVNMILSISSTTMTEFLGFFKGMVQVGSIMVGVLSYIRKKIDIGDNLNLKSAPDVKLEEDGVGKIVKGVNTTVDVGTNEITKQAKKFGNKVDKNGVPPLLNKKITANTTSHKLYNLGLAETYSAIELAIMEGGHSVEPSELVDEGIKDTLKKAAMVGTIGALGMGAIGTKNAYDREYNTKPSISSHEQSIATSTDHEPDSKLAPKTSIHPKERPDSKLAPKTSIRPRPRDTLTASPYETYFANYAKRNGITGIELAALLAQSAHETDLYSTMVEYGDKNDFDAYEGKNGNNEAGDGYKYRGRGYLHLTGKENYKKAGDAIGFDLVDNPNLVLNPKIAAATSVWYWINNVRPDITDFTDVSAVTAEVNGGDTGLKQRSTNFEKYMDLFQKSGKIEETLKKVNGKWALVSKTNPDKVLQYYHGAKDKKPSEQWVNKVEHRVHAFESNENESNLIDLTTARDTARLQKFHKEFMNKIRDNISEKQAILDIMHDMGLFDDLPIGSRIKLSKGGSYKVIGYSVKSAKNDVIPNHEKEFRTRFEFGKPLFIKGETGFYSPLVYLEQMGGEDAGSKGAFQLDKLVNFDTNTKRYTKFTGPAKVNKSIVEMKIADDIYNSKSHMQLSTTHKLSKNELTPMELDEMELLQTFLKQRPDLFENTGDYNLIKQFVEDCNENPVVGNMYIFARLMSIVPGKMINYSYFTKPCKLIAIEDGRYIFEVNGKYQMYPARQETNDMLNFSLFFDSIADEQAFRSDLWLQFSNNNWRVSDKKVVIESKSTQVKGKEKLPKLSKPSTNGFQKHPYTDRLVGEDITDPEPKEWYHGTPEVNKLRAEGGFTHRTINVSYITDPEKWNRLQKELETLNSSDDKYFALLDEVSKLKKYMTVKNPVFLTNVFGVAKTYATDKPAFDIQTAVSKVLKVSVESGKTLSIYAGGNNFRGISVDAVIKGLTENGISEDKIQKALQMFTLHIRNGKLSTDSLAVIAQLFDFDIIDVKGVLDSYNVGKTPSTVRMVFDPSKIKIISGLHENISVTGTETAQDAKRKNIQPGTDEWFEHWFSLPYMNDHRKKKRSNHTKMGITK